MIWYQTVYPYVLVLGRVLSLAHINDVDRTLPDVHINMYVDDCVLYTTANNWNHVYASLQLSLGNFDAWCKQYYGPKCV